MAPKTNLQPFYHGLDEIPQVKIKEIQKIRNWLLTQPHLPEISNDYIYVFLFSCHFSIERAKSAIEHYFSIRTNHPEIFGNRNTEDPRIKHVRSLGHLWRLPKTTPEGYRIVMYSVRDNDPTKMVFAECVKTFCMFNDIVLSEDGIEEGYIVIFDMKGVQLGHLARVSLPALRCFFLYIQEAHPVRIKGVHVLNTASWIHHIMRIIMPMVKSELLSLVKFAKGNEPEGFPLQLLPAEYGGQTSTVEELDKDTELLWDKYHQWLLDNEKLKSDDSKRITKKSSWWSWSLFGSKTNEELDEKNIMKNLRYE
ncbi:alpha-tocopherol transfer protein-like isoform X4 [Diorhabda carinulata]|uniref:alpha-tocopherol transfer protein-like isoform X4 n=1 Tax=Diorhabda carinulata TaxID=1163345 RepID=UPI0025A2823E|nr:alpha-tocopherol transfer protein-like isoform X4 [Diorhabda carinulata]